MLKENKKTMKYIDKQIRANTPSNIMTRGFGKTNMLIAKMKLAICYNIMKEYTEKSKEIVTIDEVDEMVIFSLTDEFNEEEN